MNTAITETALVINPLSASISNGIVKSINFILDRMSNRVAHKRAIQDLACSLKIEYPRESEEYVYNMAIDMYSEYENV